MDLISKLPPGIIETILCLMPIQDAARTSILSREWRYHWTKIPKLAFIERTFQVSNNQADLSVLEQTFTRRKRRRMYKRRKLLYAIYQVLLIHQGPIHEFTLRMEVDDSCVEINHIILHLSNRNTVKILQLDFTGRYVLPLSFCSLHQLTNLSLRNCSFDRLLSFSGFGCLTTLFLCLQHTFMHVKTLMCLLSSCPLLKRLSLDYNGEIISDGKAFTIVDLFKCLPLIEYLYVPCSLVEHFIPERLPKELPTTLIHLKCLDIHRVCVSHKHELPFLALLIRSSPNLEKLKLYMYDEYNLEDDEYSSSRPKDYFDFTLKHLNELELLHFSETDGELNFVKLILDKSPVLKKVKIFPYPHSDEEDESKLKEFIPKVLLRSPCASPSVKIIVG